MEHIIDSKEKLEELKAGELPLVVDFWATWCGPCRVLGPVISQLAEQFDGKIAVAKCDAEANEELIDEYGVRNVPTVLMFKNGEIVDKFTGNLPKNKIEEKFNALIA
jgi:thioredoxin 1